LERAQRNPVSRACACGGLGLAKAKESGAPGQTATTHQSETHGQDEGKGSLSPRETGTRASEEVSFEALHEQVGVLEQRALGELEEALEAISVSQETVAEPSDGESGIFFGEEGLWSDLSSFPDLFLMCVGTNRRAIYFNDAMLRSLDYMAEEVSGVDVVRTLFPGPEQEKAEAVFSGLRETRRTISFETEMSSKNRATFSVHWQMKLVRSPDERHEYFLGIGMRKTQPAKPSHWDEGFLEIEEQWQRSRRGSYANGDALRAKGTSGKGFHSRWAYLIVYVLTSASLCVLGALSGPKAVYYNGWLVMLRLTRGLVQMDVPDHPFMFGQAFLGDYALLVGAAIFFVVPGLVAVAFVNAARSFKKE
jgi:PAS domain S-box-containing protein